MSSSPLDLPVLISQLHYVQKFAHAEQTSPALQKQLFGPIIAEHLRQQGKEQVQNIDPKEKTNAVDRDGKGNTPQQHAEEQKEQKEKEQETITSNASPWAGNIVNVKI
ncbi:hypothetical protein [Pseudodesulfovibrio senegalensis]|jgi:hypothetical protein|uniref:Uncharacterized protein n=1 Tax=Pseudodesulfovibrio senegalensis TaxID=1721087 RepID=A0A6N6N8V4_9BACT|nr:hypothetical protein [Pseudodesulfovibrio senegalensis]KAB1443649.1 hypothetical protein F8A88_05265 [Pseudodesulfovibrio senegalensis]